MPGKICALAGAAPASAAIAAPPAKNIVTAFMALTPHLFPTRRMERAAADFAPSHHVAAPAVNGAVGSGSAVVLRDPVPAPQPPLTVPQFHRTAVAPPFGDGNRGIVVLGLEFAEMVDVAAEAIEIIKPVIQHAPPRPPGAAMRSLPSFRYGAESALSRPPRIGTAHGEEGVYLSVTLPRLKRTAEQRVSYRTGTHMSLGMLDSWLARQPISRKLDSLAALTIALVALVVTVQIVAAYEGLQSFERTRQLHGEAIASLNLEKDLASLERDVFHATADPNQTTIAAAEGNISDLKDSITAAEAAVHGEHHVQVHAVRDGEVRYEGEFAELKSELLHGNDKGALATMAQLAATGRFMDKTIESMRNDYKAKVAAEDASVVRAAIIDLILVAIAGMLVIMASRLLTNRIGGSVSEPLARISAILERLIGEDYSVEIDGAQRDDEIGALARAAQALRETGLEKTKLQESEAELRERESSSMQRAESQRRAALTATADDFEKTVMEVVNTVAATATQIESGSRETNAAAARSRNVSSSVASAAGQASNNVQ